MQKEKQISECYCTTTSQVNEQQAHACEPNTRSEISGWRAILSQCSPLGLRSTAHFLAALELKLINRLFWAEIDQPADLQLHPNSCTFKYSNFWREQLTNNYCSILINISNVHNTTQTIQFFKMHTADNVYKFQCQQ